MKLFLAILLTLFIQNSLIAQHFNNETEAKIFIKNHKVTDSIEGIWTLTSSMDVYENNALLKTVEQNEHTKRIVIFFAGDTIHCLNTDGTAFGSSFEKTAVQNQYIYTDYFTDEHVSASLYFRDNIMTTSYFLPKGISKAFLREESDQKKLKHNLKFIKIFPIN